jgi:hypothetical protein
VLLEKMKKIFDYINKEKSEAFRVTLKIQVITFHEDNYSILFFDLTNK